MYIYDHDDVRSIYLMVQVHVGGHLIFQMINICTYMYITNIQYMTYGIARGIMVIARSIQWSLLFKTPPFKNCLTVI